MAEEPRAPVAIRIVRPYHSEEEFLAKELESLTRTTVTLLGAQAKPQGVILRFEMTLATGQPLLRGEGRVVGFRGATATTEPGLTLRFTRLDARSKALVDRAGGARDARARASFPPPALPPPPPPSPPTSGPAESPRPKVEPFRIVESVTDLAALKPSPPPKVPPPSPPRRAEPRKTVTTQFARTIDRDAALDRLRQRARGLSRETVAKILTKRPT